MYTLLVTSFTYLSVKDVANVNLMFDFKDGRDIATVMEDLDDVIALKNSFELTLFPNLRIC